MREQASKTDGLNLRVVLYEGTGATPLSTTARLQTLTALLENGFEVSRPAPCEQAAPCDGESVLVLGHFKGSSR